MKNYIDIILIAIIALFILLKLYSVLGTSNGGEKKMKNKLDFLLAKFSKNKNKKGSTGILLIGKKKPQLVNIVKKAEPIVGKGKMYVALRKMQSVDETFSVEIFLKEAEFMFEKILKLVRAGNLIALKRLVSKKVYNTLFKVIQHRNAMKIKVNDVLVGVEKLNIVEARYLKTKDSIAVNIVSEHIFAKEKEGKLIEGDGHHIEKVNDKWVFSKMKPGNFWRLEKIEV